jgi:hypothetical protein
MNAWLRCKQQAFKNSWLGGLWAGRMCGGAPSPALPPPPPHLGPQGDLHRICQLLHARQQPRAALIAKAQLLCGVAAGLQGGKGLRAALVAGRRLSSKQETGKEHDAVKMLHRIPIMACAKDGALRRYAGGHGQRPAIPTWQRRRQRHRNQSSRQGDPFSAGTCCHSCAMAVGDRIRVRCPPRPSSHMPPPTSFLLRRAAAPRSLAAPCILPHLGCTR